MRRYVLDSHDWEKSGIANLSRGEKQALRYETSLTIFDNGAIAFKHSTKFTGVNKHSNKRWFRWNDDSSVAVRPTTSGKYVPTSRVGNKWYGGTVALDSWMSHARPTIDQAFDDIVYQNRRFSGAKKVDKSDIEHVESVVRHFQVLPLGALSRLERGLDSKPKGSLHLLQEPDPAALTRTLFGKTRYRKDLVKAVAESHIGISMLGSCFRGLAPTEWIIEFMRNSTGIHFIGQNPLVFRKALLNIDKRSYRHLLNDPATLANQQYVADSVLGAGSFDVTGLAGMRPKDWSEMHEIFYPNRGRLYRGNVIQRLAPVAKTNLVIKPSELSKRIDAAFKDTRFTHVLPADSNELVSWSNTMGNCIRGYDHMAKSHRTNLGAVLIGDKMVVNYEVSKDGNCRQLLGKFNASLDRQVHDEVRSIMEGAGVKFEQYYAGQLEAYQTPLPVGHPLDMNIIDW